MIAGIALAWDAKLPQTQGEYDRFALSEDLVRRHAIELVTPKKPPAPCYCSLQLLAVNS